MIAAVGVEYEIGFLPSLTACPGLRSRHRGRHEEFGPRAPDLTSSFGFA
jgi:hypothetical protein